MRAREKRGKGPKEAVEQSRLAQSETWGIARVHTALDEP